MQATPSRGGLTEEWYAISRCYTGSLLFDLLLLLLLLPRTNQSYLSQGSVSPSSNHLGDPSVPESFFKFALLHGMILMDYVRTALYVHTINIYEY